MKRYYWAVLASISAAALLLVALLSSAASAAPLDAVTVSVNDSGGSGLTGVTIHYQCNEGPVLLFGTTVGGTASGSLPDGARCMLTAIYRGTSANQTQTIQSGTTFTFQTSAVTVKLEASDTSPLAGGAVAYKPTVAAARST